MFNSLHFVLFLNVNIEKFCVFFMIKTINWHNKSLFLLNKTIKKRTYLFRFVSMHIFYAHKERVHNMTYERTYTVIKLNIFRKKQDFN